MKPLSLSRWLAAAALASTLASASFSSQAAFSGLYVFGDSVSDSGNNALAIGINASQVITGNGYVPIQPYASGVYSNGPVWATSFASALGLGAVPSLAGGGNFAFGGATTGIDGAAGGFPPSLRSQLNLYLGGSGGVAAPGALYVIAGGGNNVRTVLEAIGGGAPPVATIASAAAGYANDVGAMVDALQAAGAANIVVWNTPNVGATPAAASQGTLAQFFGTAAANSFNSALAARLAGESGVMSFDVFGLFTAVGASPGAYGLTNITDACGAVLGCDASKYLFWDGLHPTAAGHLVLANALIAVVPEPQSYLLFSAGILMMLVWCRRA